MIRGQLLKASAARLLTEDVRAERSPIPDVSSQYEAPSYVLDIEPLMTVVEHAMKAFPVAEEPSRKEREKKRTKCDSWLAPRVHAALRLTRRQAADPKLWFYLATASGLSDYVFYRWGKDASKKAVKAPFLWSAS